MDRKKKPSLELDMAFLLTKECKKSIQYEILSAWVSKDFPRFINAIGQKSFDLEYVYEDFYKLRLLDLTCKVVGCEEYVKAIIDVGANVNSSNPITSKSPIHYAAESGNVPVMKLLVASGADVNAQDDMGDTALHSIVRKWEPGKLFYVECFRYLLEQPDIEVNVPNGKGYTVIHLAVAMGDIDFAIVLFQKGLPLDLDTYRVGHTNTTAREEILKSYPEMESRLPAVWGSNPVHKTLTQRYRLFYLICNKQEIRFCQAFREAMQDETQKHLLLTYHDGRHTYLQHACEKGLTKAAKMLLKYGADANYAPRKTESPVSLACRGGHHEILSLLLPNSDVYLTANEDGETPLHVVCKCPTSSSGHQECLKKLLRQGNCDVNLQDDKGKTALHFAVKYGGENCVFELLNHGASMEISDKFGETPIGNMSYSTLKKYLDSKITTNGELPKDTNYAVVFDCQFLAEYDKGRQEDPIYRFKTDLLLYLTKSSELKKLLAHPLLSTIILFKWHRIRMFFYVNLMFYSLFCVLLTSYILLDQNVQPNNSTTFGGIDVSKIKTARLTDANSAEPLRTVHDLDGRFALITRWILFLFLAILALTEVVQLVSSQLQYFWHLENYLEISVIVLSSVLLCYHCSENNTDRVCPQLSALSILLAWSQFFFTMGKHPKLTFYIDMFRTASGFLFRFLTVHTCLILAFALSFHELFRRCETCTDNPFSNPGQAIFKTVVMLTGEFEINNMPFDTYVGTSHVIFVAFIFLVAIVLFNLLIGLAVSATRPIEDDAFLYGCIAQVPIISYFENNFFSNTSPFKRIVRHLCLSGCCSKKRTYAATGQPTVFIYPNQKNRMEVKYTTDDQAVHLAKKSNIRRRLDQKIVEDSQSILANKQDDKTKKRDKFDELKFQLESCKNSLEEEIRSCKNALIEILEKLETQEQDTDQDLQNSTFGTLHQRKKKKSDALLRKLKMYGSWVDDRVGHNLHQMNLKDS